VSYGIVLCPIVGLVALSDFALLSKSSLRMAVQGPPGMQKGAFLDSWLQLLNSSKPELVAAVLQGVSGVLGQPDLQYVQNDRDAAAGTALGSVFDGTTLVIL
jgi:hypothetical protein